MLARAAVAVRLPAQDLERARAFYAEKLGLEPTEARPGGLRYRLAGGEFALFESAGQPSGEHTQIAFEVDDIDASRLNLSPEPSEVERYAVGGPVALACVAVPATRDPRFT
jgi:catechol 2,3-dioxygenase-like lactoylglutathione lyase family enzyme